MTADPSGAIVKIDGKAVSKVGVKLIEKVAEGIGGLYRPVGIVREAKANAKAEVIAALAAQQVSEIQQRAVQRFVAEEVRRQENIEKITAEAINHLHEDAEPSKINDDWMANFFEKARIVSDEEMQSIWSKILADEANAPGKFSKRTINLLSDLDKSDALMFSTLCQFSANFGSSQLLVFNPDAAVYNASGINFPALSHLESLGLIKFETLTGFTLTGLPQYFSFTYAGRQLNIALKKSGDSFQTGKAMFTRMGSELSTLIEVAEVPGFFDYLSAQFESAGIMHSVSKDVTVTIPSATHQAPDTSSILGTGAYGAWSHKGSDDASGA